MEEIDDNVIDFILQQPYFDETKKMVSFEEIDLTDKKILILCGSGCSKNYNIDTFEEMKKKGYYDIFSLNNFENDTLEFHKSINKLKEKCNQLNQIINKENIFIVTTNIDGLFIGENIFEIHGNIFEYKCNCCKEIFTIQEIIDLPTCINCNCILRPNIQLYGDGDFVMNKIQIESYTKFKKEINVDNTVIFEFGCGLLVPLLRHESQVLYNKGFSVYRINVKDFDNSIPNLNITGKQFLEKIF